MFHGVFTALVTPFKHSSTQVKVGGENNLIDEESFREFIEWQIKEGIHGLVPVGTTGESPTLSYEEHKELVEICVEQADKRVPVIAGAGSNSTQEAIFFVQHAQEAGADAVLVVTPYYNKPDQKGLYRHFALIAENSNIPIIIYNIPGRSIIDMSAETMARLHNDYKMIIGVKDATGKVERVSEQREKCGKDFLQFSGDDNTALGFNAHGGIGCISVVSNIAPHLCSLMQEASRRGDYQAALAIHDQLAPLCRALFLEPSPAGVKYAVEKIGKGSHMVRSPIMPLENRTKEIIDAALAHAKLI